MNNLFIIILTAFVTLNSALDQDFIDELMEQLQEIGGQCAEEVHATSQDIADLVAQKFPPSSHEGKCMLFCIQKKFKMMKDDGTIDKVGSIQALAPLKKADADMYTKVLKLFISCGLQAKINADPCETATGLAICGQTKAKEMGIDNFML